MDNETAHPACVLHGLELLRRWTDELEGRNRHTAYELMHTVMAGDLTNEEAFALLDTIGSGCD
jgi:hypothetical protein